MARASRAVAAILPFYERYKSEVEAESVLGVQEDVFRGPIPYFPYLSAAGALFKITGSLEYELAIRKFFDIRKNRSDIGPSTHWKSKVRSQQSAKPNTRGSINRDGKPASIGVISP
jgi:hypothetical protein